MKKILIVLSASLLFSCSKTDNLFKIPPDSLNARLNGSIVSEGNLVITKEGTFYDGQGDTVKSIVIKTSYVSVKNVVVKGGSDSSGISIISTNKPLNNVIIDNVNVIGYKYVGINAYGTLRSLIIKNSKVSENGFAGIYVSCIWPQIRIDHISITNVDAFNNKGIRGQKPHTGHGIIVGGVNYGVIDNCRAWNNGYVNGDGNIGIWAYDSKYITIKNSTSYKNQSVTGIDGGGFDLDGGVSNSTIQNCVSYENDGAGYLLYEWGSPNPCQNNTFKNNTSNLDGQGNVAYSGFSLGGVQNVYNTTIQGNTVTPITGRAPVTYFGKQYLIGLTFIGNNF